MKLKLELSSQMKNTGTMGTVLLHLAGEQSFI